MIDYKYGWLNIHFKRRSIHVRLCRSWDGRFSVKGEFLPLIGRKKIKIAYIYTIPYLAVMTVNMK